MAWYPKAIRKNIPPPSSDPRINARAVILHVAASEASSLYGWFNGPSGGVESHTYIRRDGETEQYRDTDYQADANVSANSFAISVETQGGEYGEWTDAQIRSIKEFILWAHKTHGVPLRVCRHASDSGIGYHTLFPGAWDTRGASCPGPDRKRQFNNVIVPWLKSNPNKVDFDQHTTRIYDREDVKRFQRFHGFTNGADDGLWGPETEKQAQAIRRTLKPGMSMSKWDRKRYWALRNSRTPKSEQSSHEMRKGLQWALGVTPLDGIWGPKTEAAWLAIRDQHKMF